LTTLFTSKADLSALSDESKGYQIEELVQHVAIRIDEAYGSESALSAGNVQGRQNEKATEVTIDEPFVFYVRDTESDVIMTTGRILDVPQDEEVPVIFNI
jgi:serine protease inhibitor